MEEMHMTNHEGAHALVQAWAALRARWHGAGAAQAQEAMTMARHAENTSILTDQIGWRYEGPGIYWLSDGQRSLPLGHCANLVELADAVDECVSAGSGAEDWTGWTASPE